jgi:hypothetical protein
MTRSMKVYQAGSIVIWPEVKADDYQYEHAIVVMPYGDTVGIEQNGQSITIPRYAFAAVLKAMRDVAKEPQ